MNYEPLLETLRKSENLLPQQVLANTTIDQLVVDLGAIFNQCKKELDADPQFRNNFIETVNYVYLLTLKKSPEQRDKQLFSRRLITALLQPKPIPAQ